ncbi:uncharacterized protein LOC135102701 isoform X1 [Scylla paramamosain]|uniref:uncharacterized protein LOC135102701 isoform X1 n=1 Tax=Scylla paramamosain TaxID=85552 RepID=UPI003082DBD5
MSLVEAAAALDRLLAGQTRDASTSRLWSAGTASVPRWGVNPASASPQSPLPNTRTAFLDHTLSSEGLVPAQSTKVVLHSTPKDDTPRHAPPQLPLLNEAPLFETLRNPPTLTPAPVSTLTSTPARPGQAHYFVHASHAAPPSPSIPVPASLSIPIPISPSLPASHSLPVSSHSFTTSRPIPISASSSVPASSSSPSSSPIFLSALPNPCPVEGRSAEARGTAGVSELWPEGVRSGRKGGRSLAFLFSRPDPTKFKTELCRSYQVHGFCRYGMRCNYAHGLQQLRGAIHHGKYKTRNCKSYHEKGCCRYGARCSFIHDPEEGVLKCSIANKEVLEALHYCPDSEESFRTAKITWRLVDSSSSPPPELHFITSNTQDTQAAHRDAAALISGTGVEHGSRQLHSKQDVTPLPLPAVRHAPSGVFGQLEGACKHHVLPVSALGTRGNKNVAWKATPLSSRTWRKACSEHDVHHPRVPLTGPGRGAPRQAAAPRPSLPRPSLTPRQRRLV